MVIKVNNNNGNNNNNSNSNSKPCVKRQMQPALVRNHQLHLYCMNISSDII